MFELLGLFGVGAIGIAWWFGLLPAIVAVVTPILRVLAGWLMDLLDFIVRRFIREVKALFDVFPFLVLFVVFLAGGIYFQGSKAVIDSGKETIEKITEKVTPRKRARRRRQPDFVQRLFTNPFRTLGVK